MKHKTLLELVKNIKDNNEEFILFIKHSSILDIKLKDQKRKKK